MFELTQEYFLQRKKKKLDWQYPAKPFDSTVHTTLLTNTESQDDTISVNVRWMIPLEIEAISNFNEGSKASKRYRFCVTVSRKQPKWTICDELGGNLESVHCVNQTTNTLNISNLKTGNLYYITVFIRDIESGGTTALEPSGMFIPPSNTRKSYLHESSTLNVGKKMHKLPDAKLKNGKLAARQGSVQSYRFHVHQAAADQRKILIVIYACTGFVRMAVRRKGEEIFRSNSFSGYHRFLVTDVITGYITVDVINDDEKAKKFRIWASTAPQKIPYPQMPENTSIKIMKRTCSSVTLQWMKSHNTEVRYCLYKRREEAKNIGELIEKNRDFCHTNVPGSELVACYTIYTKPEAFVLKSNDNIRSYDYEGDAYNPIFETTVSGLHPGTAYHFDLLAQPLHRSHTQHLPYRTVWARTLSC